MVILLKISFLNILAYPGYAIFKTLPSAITKQKKSVEKSDIYKSIREAREKRKNGSCDVPEGNPAAAQLPQKDKRLDISHIDDSGDKIENNEVNGVVLGKVLLCIFFRWKSDFVF